MSKPYVLTAGLMLVLLSGVGFIAGQENKAGEAKPAKKKQERKSPHEEVSWTLGGKKITIVYGRPYKRGRVIFGGLEPWGKVWRTGADEATTFTTEGDLMLGALHVTAGTYSLFTIPNEKEWTLILNKTVKQWGAFNYDQSTDYGRTPMKVERAPATIEQLTIDLEKKDNSNGVLKIKWNGTSASVDVMAH